MSIKTVVVIPTINEIYGLGKIIPIILDLGHDILVVDDNSTDGTQEFVLNLESRHPNRMQHLFRPKKNGLKDAYFSAFQQLKQSPHDLILMMDGDGAHHPEHIPEMHFMIDKGANLVLGSRYVNGGVIENFPLFRRATSSFGNTLCRSYISNKIRDWTTGYMLWQKDLLFDLLDEEYAQGFGFLIQIKKYALDREAKVVEIPIRFSNCVTGKSKYNRKIAFEALGILRGIKTNKRGMVNEESH